MVTIDDEGNKINCWVERRFDTTTNEVVEVEHTTLLAEADDEEHWMSRTTYEASELDEGATICTMFIYAAEEVQKSIKGHFSMTTLLLSSHHRLAKEIPIPKLMLMLKELQLVRTQWVHTLKGLILEATMIHTDLLALLVDCGVESAEALRDALFEIYPNIDYIEIVY